MEPGRILLTFATTLYWNAAQFAAGSLVALVVFVAVRGVLPRVQAPVMLVAVSGVVGAVLPCGTYGVLPVVGLLGAAGLPAPASAALLLSNRFFNMLVPSADPGFTWSTGFGRPLLAAAVGIGTGLLLLPARNRDAALLRFPARDPGGKSASRTAGALLAGLAWKAAIALAVGAILEIIYRDYLLGEIVGFLFSNRVTGPLALSFAQRNVVNPFFMLGAWCIAVVADLVGLSGLALAARPKGVLLYIGCGAALAALLCSSSLFL